ncbi:MAG: phage portal protein, partial [Actinomycetota bacterium]
MPADVGDFTTRAVAGLVQNALFPLWDKERRKMKRLDRWHRNDLEEGPNGDLPYLRRATKEYRTLQRISTTPWARLVVNSTVDVLHLEGLVDGDGNTDEETWRVWQANGMDGRQSSLWEGATALGRSYVTAEPGRDPLSGEQMPRLRVWPATQTLTYYEDPANDDWPIYAMIGRWAKKSDGSGFWRMHVYDDERVFTVDVDPNGGDAKYIEFSEHGAGVCP